MTVNPQEEITWAACAGSVPISPAELFIAKYTPGWITVAAMSAIIATNDSINIPPYPMKRIWPSFSIIFGVVPDAISACQPDTAPQAMVMKRNGNKLPAQTGPVPSTKRVTAAISRSGRTMIMPIASSVMVPILRNVER